MRDNCEKSAYHPSCTNKMGSLSHADGGMSVVDSETRVHGVKGLRVVDSSIMPSIPNGNLNGPTIMIAEKAADLILGRKALPPASEARPWVADNWQTTQREAPPLRAIPGGQE